MDIVIVSPTPTHPIDFGNRKRIHRVARDLQDRGCRVHFVLYALEDPWRYNFPAEAYAQMREAWDEFHVVIPTVPFHKSAEGEDHALDEWWDVSLEKFLWWYLQSRQFDAVLVNYVYLSRALTLAPPGTLRILDTHDKFGGRRELLAQLGLPAEFFHLTEAEEAKGVRRADLVLAIKDEEQAYFDALGAKDTMTLPFSDPLREMPRGAPRESDGFLRIGMIGGRNNINRVSAERFLDLMVSRIFTTAAPIRIVLAGTMCQDLERYAGKFCVEMVGPVDDVSDFYERIDAAVVPMEVSTGQKIKLGEALSFGVPVIAHAHAFEGYTPTHQMHGLRSIPEICEACIDIAFDQEQLDVLRGASISAVSFQEARAAHAGDALVEAVRSVPTIVMTVDAEAFLASRQLRAFVQMHLNFMRSLLKPELVFLHGGAADAAAAIHAVQGTRTYLACARVAKITFLDAPALDAAFLDARAAVALWPVRWAHVAPDALAGWTGLLAHVPDFEEAGWDGGAGTGFAFDTPWPSIVELYRVRDGAVTHDCGLATRLHASGSTTSPRRRRGLILHGGRTPLALFDAIDACLRRNGDAISVIVACAGGEAIVPSPAAGGRFDFVPAADCGELEDVHVPWVLDLSAGEPRLAGLRGTMHARQTRRFAPAAPVRGRGGPFRQGSSYVDLFDWLDGLADAPPPPEETFDPLAGLFRYFSAYKTMHGIETAR